MNKFSNNLMSRLLLLTLAAEAHGAPATVGDGRRAVEDWVRARGFPTEGLNVGNGSGLSREARVTAQQLGEMLVAAYRSPTMPELMASLAIAGRDGTMRRRLRNTPVAGRAHIKTGSLNDVSAMAGYVLDRNDRRWVVTALINHRGLMHWQGRQVQDALLRCAYQIPVDAAGLGPGGVGAEGRACGWGRPPQSVAEEAHRGRPRGAGPG
jgi:D-alanyl-D-alanine carboxypeptidase/D-alanyl-D-alanine-endopeptidase (penicillin-binding protein 4)